MNVVIFIIVYYDVFNCGDCEVMLLMLIDDVVYDLNQGVCEVGCEVFCVFLQCMDCCYGE